MKILQVIASLAPRYGGPSVACPALCRELARRGHRVAIYTTNTDGHTTRDVPLDKPVWDQGVEIRYFPGRSAPGEYNPSLALWRALDQTAQRFDVAHIYSVYGFSTLAGAHHCRKHGVPYVLHPHGSLDPFLLRRHRFRKRVYTALFARRGFEHAAAILFNSREEMRLAVNGSRSVASVGRVPQAVRLAVVYVGVEDVWFHDPGAAARERVRKKFGLSGRRLLVFFGRLNFKKGLDLLARAFSLIGREHDNIHLVLAGPDTEGYGKKVRKWLQEGQVLEKTTFTGALEGVERCALMREAEVFVLPSFSENFGQAVAEAMACNTPVVISDQVNIWPEVAEAGAGMVVPCEPQQLAGAVRTLLDNPTLGKRMGSQGRQLVEKKMTWKVVGDQMLQLYHELLCEPAKQRAISIISPEQTFEP